jgi:pre-mRNA cleavage complex 2 protein Pcf11
LLQDWIKSKADTEDDQQNPDGASRSPDTAAARAAEAAKNDPKNQFILVPNDPTQINSTCPICQEKFETVWHDQAQEWVWMDAIKIGGRVYHASCHAEARKDRETTPMRAATPDVGSLLGKRKAEDSPQDSSKLKIKKEEY